MRLLLLRHGQTPSNVLGRLDTAVPGAPLTDLGTRQAKAVPAGLSRFAPVETITVSTLIRTQFTAAPLAERLGIEPLILGGLKEIQAGDLEMRNDPESQGLYNATAFAWAEGDLDLRMPGAENGHEFFERFDTAIDAVVGRGGDTALVVSHGAAIRTWVAARGAQPDGGSGNHTDGHFAGIHQLDNTGLAVLEEPGHDRPSARRWQLVDWISTPIGGEQLHDRAAEDPTGTGLE
jgi:broad specificity phosphatase PhoE